MKKLLLGVFAAALTASFTALAPAQAATERKTFAQIFFPKNENYRGKHRMSDKSPIKRKVIKFNEKHAKGTIIIDTSDRRLYHVLGDGKAMVYGVGVGRQGFEWRGTQRISRKAEWPSWTPPATMRAREAKKGRILPKFMKGGPNNPMGARALYLGSSIYRIHGTNQPWTIGQAMSSGCIRMANDDVKHLYERAKVGTRVIVRN